MNILSHLHTISTTLTTLTPQWFVDSCGIHPMPCRFGDGDLTNAIGKSLGMVFWIGTVKIYPHFYWLISSHTYPIYIYPHVLTGRGWSGRGAVGLLHAQFWKEVGGWVWSTSVGYSKEYIAFIKGYIYTYIYIYAHIYIYAYMHIIIYICIHAYNYIYMHTCI